MQKFRVVELVRDTKFTGRANTGLVLPVIDGLSLVDSQITLGNVSNKINNLICNHYSCYCTVKLIKGYILIDTDIDYKASFMNRRAQ